MGLTNLLEQPLGVRGNIGRSTSSSLRRSQKCVRAPPCTEVIDEGSRVEVDAHYAAGRCVRSSSGVTTWGFSAVTNVFSFASRVTKKSQSTALLRMRISFEWANR